MDSFHQRNKILPFESNMIPTKLESYKVDEGYSEDTRSQDGSESSMHMDLPKNVGGSIQAMPSISLPDLAHNLSEFERGEIAYDLLRGLRASSIAGIFDRLWPLFHKDPLQSFPAEIMSLILSYLEPNDLLVISLVSKSWRDRVTDSNLWKRKFNTEGWGLDAGEISRLESTFQHPLSPAKESSGVQPFSSSALFGQQQGSPTARWSSNLDQAHPQPEADVTYMDDELHPTVDHEMMDVNGEVQRSPVSAPQEPSPDRMQISSPTGKRVPPRKREKQPPLVIRSPPGYSRVNYHYIFKHKRRLEDNWDKGLYRNFQLPHRNAPYEAHEECVYTIQYQGDYLVSGSRDRTLRIWDLNTGRLVQKPLKGHTGSVLCLQFDCRPEEDIIVSGSSDTNVILWRFSTGQMIKKLTEAHKESVLNLRFDHRFLVTCSKDKTIKIWNRHQLRPGDRDYPIKGLPGGGECPSYIIDAPSLSGAPGYQPSNPSHLMDLEPYTHLMTLDQHGAAVNAIQIYKDQLVSASGDRTLRLWNIHTGECHSKIPAHEKGIACVQYDGKRIVSGSSDNSIRIWDPATKTEVARLEGHTRLVRTLQAAFADVPGGREQLEAEAAEVGRSWAMALQNGEDLNRGRHEKSARPGSRRPRDLRSARAKIPPSGGGSRWARIVSGSYDEKVIVWKKNADDEWIVSHQLAQEEALTAAGPPLPARVQFNAGPSMDEAAGDAAPAARGASLPQLDGFAPSNVPHPPLSLPAILNADMPPASASHAISSSLHTPRASSHAPGSRHGVESPHKSPRRSLSTSSHSRRQAAAAAAAAASSSSSSERPDPPQAGAVPGIPSAADVRHHSPRATGARAPSTGVPTLVFNPTPWQTAGGPNAGPGRPPHPQAGPGPTGGQPNARVFKLQFDARRIICCSQDNKIVGWDFANGDEDIIACSKYFAEPQ